MASQINDAIFGIAFFGQLIAAATFQPVHQLRVRKPTNFIVEQREDGLKVVVVGIGTVDKVKGASAQRARLFGGRDNRTAGKEIDFEASAGCSYDSLDYLFRHNVSRVTGRKGRLSSPLDYLSRLCRCRGRSGGGCRSRGRCRCWRRCRAAGNNQRHDKYQSDYCRYNSFSHFTSLIESSLTNQLRVIFPEINHLL